MKDNKEHVSTFLDILRHAKDKDGLSVFTDDEIKLIAGKENEKLLKSPKSLENAFGGYLSRVNAVLSSEYGRTKIDALYVSEMKRHSEHVELVIASMKNLAAKKFYDSILGRMLLIDYHNQYYIKWTIFKRLHQW